jgi:hypothetical protein
MVKTLYDAAVRTGADGKLMVAADGATDGCSWRLHLIVAANGCS